MFIKNITVSMFVSLFTTPHFVESIWRNNLDKKVVKSVYLNSMHQGEGSIEENSPENELW